MHLGCENMFFFLPAKKINGVVCSPGIINQPHRENFAWKLGYSSPAYIPAKVARCRPL